MNGAAGTVRVSDHGLRPRDRRATAAAGVAGRRCLSATTLAVLMAAALLLAPGCARGPHMLTPTERKTIDRAKVEYPAGFDLERHVVNLTAPRALAFDKEGNLIIAGGKDSDVWITGFRPDGTTFNVYPVNRSLLSLGFGSGKFSLYGPIGGMLVYDGMVYVSHRDGDGLGVISALDYKGNRKTIVAGLPAQGEHGVTDLAIDPKSGRLFFGVGTATNSGVVGRDDFDIGWVRDHPTVHDVPWSRTKLLGRRFNTRNPDALLIFGGNDLSVSAPFQEYGVSNRTTIPGVGDGPEKSAKFNGGLFSIPAGGGELFAEAHGIRYPRGLVFDEYGHLYFTNDGMEMRGSRPVKDDPDSLLRLNPGLPNLQIAWYGWPDFTTDLHPVTDAKYQPPEAMILPYGYPDLSFVLDLKASGLNAPNPNSGLVQGSFPSQSGAAGLALAPVDGPFKEYAGSAIVALAGDRAPFATGGQKLADPAVGSKVARVDMDRGQVRDFIRNTKATRGSLIGNDPDLLERPVDVVFGPDGSMYLLDFGKMRMRGGREDVPEDGTGKVYRLVPSRTK